MQKLYQTKIIKTKTNIENALIEYYIDKVCFYFKKIFKNLDY